MKVRLEKFSDSTVINLAGNCPSLPGECKCSDDPDHHFHNWLFAKKFPYLIICFDNERRMCQAKITSLTQVARRLAVPTFFVIEWQPLFQLVQQQNGSSEVQVLSSFDEAIALTAELQSETDHLMQSDELFNKTLDTNIAKKSMAQVQTAVKPVTPVL